MLGSAQGGGLPRVPILGRQRCGGPTGLVLCQEHSLPCKWLYLGGQKCASRTSPSNLQSAQVPVQLCEKCRAWKSLGEIAECLECKHFPGKGGQGM